MGRAKLNRKKQNKKTFGNMKWKQMGQAQKNTRIHSRLDFLINLPGFGLWEEGAKPLAMSAPIIVRLISDFSMQYSLLTSANYTFSFMQFIHFNFITKYMNQTSEGSVKLDLIKTYCWAAKSTSRPGEVT